MADKLFRMTQKEGSLLSRINISKRIENFFKKKIYSGGFLWKEAEKLFDYTEASQLCYKVLGAFYLQEDAKKLLNY